MDDIFAFILELVDAFTGRMLDKGIGKVANSLTHKIPNTRVRKFFYCLTWCLLWLICTAVIASALLLIVILVKILGFLIF